MRKQLLFAVVFALAGSVTSVALADYPVCYGQTGPTFGIQAPPLPPPNPLVYDSGRYLTNFCTGPLGIRHHTTTNREQVYASAYDPNRGYVDPASLRYVDRWVSDACGNSYRERGYAWTSNGVPHSDMNISDRYRTSRFGSRVDNTHVAKEASQPDGK